MTVSNSHQPSLNWARSILSTLCCSVANSNNILPSVTRSSDFHTTILHAFLYFPSVTQALLISSPCIWSQNEQHKSWSVSCSSLHPPAYCCLSRSIKCLLDTSSAYVVLLIWRTKIQTHKKNCMQKSNLYILRQQRVRKTTLDRMVGGPARIEPALYGLRHSIWTEGAIMPTSLV